MSKDQLPLHANSSSYQFPPKTEYCSCYALLIDINIPVKVASKHSTAITTTT